jgi:hypothetical protein
MKITIFLQAMAMEMEMAWKWKGKARPWNGKARHGMAWECKA